MGETTLNIKQYLAKNIYVYDFAVKFAHCKRNRIVSELIRDIEGIDSIKNYSQFAEVIEKYKKKYGVNFLFMLSNFAADSHLYGHIEALYEYAGRSCVNYNAFSKVEHGTFVQSNGIEKGQINIHTNILLMGSYKSELIHQINPYKPVFTVGPYIYYAKSIYTLNELQRIKRKFGKTLLVFPYHSCEECSVSQNNKKFVDYVMNTVAKGYDSVLVSVYWNDVGQNIYNLFDAAGAKLVSSGFRGDKRFIHRLKTLIDIADDICGNSFGTHVGYSLFSKGKFLYVDSEIDWKVKSRNIGEDESNKIEDLHLWVKTCFNNADGTLPKSQIHQYESWWGGIKALRSKEEINMILSLGEIILKRSHGFTDRFDTTVKELLTDGSLTSKELDILKGALGKGILK